MNQGNINSLLLFIEHSLFTKYETVLYIRKASD